ncbi:hypothetical protein [Enterobacter kobei]|uniref:hypothetical protein n=1 Tax=Enterobacter kobei TaxID=208224 RepID=UPI002A827703|nr:hypothetical protein [Enterobacter kobei]
MSAPVFVVSIRGFEDEMEAVAAFTSYGKAKEHVERNGFTSWAIEELTPDEECHEETNV